MSIFFKRRKIIAFEILTFDFHLEKKGICKLLFTKMQAHGNEKNERIAATQYYALLVNLFATLQQSNSLAEEKMVKY